MLLPAGEGGMSPMGTFWLFFVITALGLIWVWVTIPETAGLSLEQMDHLFSLPWYKIGLSGRKHAEVEMQFAREKELDEKNEPVQIEYVTKA